MITRLERDDCDVSIGSTAVVLDHARLASLEEMVGKDKVVDLLRRFQLTLASHVAEIVSDETGPAEKAQCAHKLVGVAGSIGFVELSEQCMHLDQSADRTEDLGALVDAVKAAADRVNAVLLVSLGPQTLSR